MKRLINIGGRWWRCQSCGITVAADCSCCEAEHRCATEKVV